MPCHAKCFTPYYWHVVMEPPWPQLLRLQCEGSWTLPPYRSSIGQLCPFYLYDVIQSQLLCSWPQGYQAWTASSPSLCFLICMPGIPFSPQSDLKKKKIRSHHFSAKNPPLSPIEPKSLPVSPTFDPCLLWSLYFSFTSFVFRYPTAIFPWEKKDFPDHPTQNSSPFPS